MITAHNGLSTRRLGSAATGRMIRHEVSEYAAPHHPLVLTSPARRHRCDSPNAYRCVYGANTDLDRHLDINQILECMLQQTTKQVFRAATSWMHQYDVAAISAGQLVGSRRWRVSQHLLGGLSVTGPNTARVVSNADIYQTISTNASSRGSLVEPGTSTAGAR